MKFNRKIFFDDNGSRSAINSLKEACDADRSTVLNPFQIKCLLNDISKLQMEYDTTIKNLSEMCYLHEELKKSKQDCCSNNCKIDVSNIIEKTKDKIDSITINSDSVFIKIKE